MEDIGGRIIYRCRYCITKRKFETTSLVGLSNHIEECQKTRSQEQIGIHYVACCICNHHGKSLGLHISSIHKINIIQYQDRFPDNKVISSNSSAIYGAENKVRPDWRIKAKAEGKDVKAIDAANGRKISAAIMANPEERKRRSKLMSHLQETVLATPENRALLSISAKKTSERPEILAQRSSNLQRWRDENPEDFKEKCTDKMLAAKPQETVWFSKPEKMLYAFLLGLPDFQFKFNQVIKSSNFDWRSQRKQVDMADKAKKTYVEFDGPFHFKLFSKTGRDKLAETKRRDGLLDGYMIEHELVLVRISYDQFHDNKTNPYFKPECLNALTQIIRTGNPGVFKIGEMYEQYSERKDD
jgi:hypothetical protein